jgi:predicted Zn-dependent protease
MDRALELVLLSCFAASLAPAQIANAQSIARERALGRQLAADVEARKPLLHDAEVDGYLHQLAESLYTAASSNLQIQAKAIAEETPHAIALPGGYVYFSFGLLAGVESEAELAAIMAHELAHISARHGLRPATGVATGVAVPLIFLGGWNGICSRFASPGLYPGSYRSAAANFELEADAAGREFMALAGFDHKALETAFGRLAPGGESVRAPTQPAPPADSSPAFEAIQQKVRRAIRQPRAEGPTLRPIRN